MPIARDILRQKRSVRDTRPNLSLEKPLSPNLAPKSLNSTRLLMLPKTQLTSQTPVPRQLVSPQSFSQVIRQERSPPRLLLPRLPIFRRRARKTGRLIFPRTLQPLRLHFPRALNHLARKDLSHGLNRKDNSPRRRLRKSLVDNLSNVSLAYAPIKSRNVK